MTVSRRYSYCDSCGTRIVVEFGRFDAVSYDNGSFTRHYCPPPEIKPINEREWQEFIATDDARILLGLRPLQAARPAPRPPVEERAPDKPRPAKTKGGYVGGIDV